jgi:hypothetical protein
VAPRDLGLLLDRDLLASLESKQRQTIGLGFLHPSSNCVTLAHHFHDLADTKYTTARSLSGGIPFGQLRATDLKLQKNRIWVARFGQGNFVSLLVDRIMNFLSFYRVYTIGYTLFIKFKGGLNREANSIAAL